jgi:hypothetical protein
MGNMSARPTPKPWPMKFVAIIIVVCLGAYTFLTLHFRKQGPVYRPYEDNKTKATVHRLRAAGYQRITAEVETPAEPQNGFLKLNSVSAEPATVPGGLPAELKDTLIDLPHLPDSFSAVQAAAVANPLFPYSLQFTCNLPDHHRLHGATYVYVKDEEIAIVSDFEQIEGELLARSADSTLRLSVPAGTLAPGRYEVTLVGGRESKRWTLQVH